MMVFKKTILTNRDASIALIYEALEFFRRIKDEGCTGDATEFDVRLVLDEALGNAMCHGNGYDLPPKGVPLIEGKSLTKIKQIMQEIKYEKETIFRRTDPRDT